MQKGYILEPTNFDFYNKWEYRTHNILTSLNTMILQLGIVQFAGFSHWNKNNFQLAPI